MARDAGSSLQPAHEAANDGPAAKKRKLLNGDAVGSSASVAVDINADSSLQFYMKDVSFAVPQRKKLTLELTAGRGYLRARNQASKDVEFGVPIDKIRECGIYLPSLLGKIVSNALFDLILRCRTRRLSPRTGKEPAAVQSLRDSPVWRWDKSTAGRRSSAGINGVDDS